MKAAEEGPSGRAAAAAAGAAGAEEDPSNVGSDLWENLARLQPTGLDAMDGIGLYPSIGDLADPFAVPAAASGPAMGPAAMPGMGWDPGYAGPAHVGGVGVGVGGGLPGPAAPAGGRGMGLKLEMGGAGDLAGHGFAGGPPAGGPTLYPAPTGGPADPAAAAKAKLGLPQSKSISTTMPPIIPAFAQISSMPVSHHHQQQQQQLMYSGQVPRPTLRGQMGHQTMAYAPHGQPGAGAAYPGYRGPRGVHPQDQLDLRVFQLGVAQLQQSINRIDPASRRSISASLYRLAESWVGRNPGAAPFPVPRGETLPKESARTIDRCTAALLYHTPESKAHNPVPQAAAGVPAR